MRHQWFLILTKALLVVMVFAAAAAAQDESEEASDGAGAVNELRRIETKGVEVEIEIRSSKPFPVRALPPVLRIGDLDFTASRNPDNGRLDTLIFFVPAEDFAAIDPQKVAMRVFYATSIEGEVTPSGRPRAIAEPGGPTWDFGELRKELLDNRRLWSAEDVE